MANLISKTIFILTLLYIPIAEAQEINSISLDSCYSLAKLNYPLIKQYQLIEQTNDLNIDNINRGILPRIQFAGQASYQSDVTSVPDFEMAVPPISKDQYRIYGEISQPLTELFINDKQKQLAKAYTQIQKQNTEVTLYQLRDRVNQLYFGILLAEQQLNQIQLFKSDIEAGIAKVRSAVENGVALRSELELLQAELLQINQKAISIQSNKATFKKMLAQFTQLSVSDFDHLEKPVLPHFSNENNRPERLLYANQRDLNAIKQTMISDKSLPRFNLFFQGGYGRPALNMLDDNFKPYFITGIKLQWNVSSFYTTSREKQILNLNQSELAVQEENFLFNTQLNIEQQETEVGKLKKLIQTDQEIIALRENIKNTSQSQLEYGVITASDYLQRVNEANRARQDLSYHEIQLMAVLYDNKTTTGN
ncbi:TolC family protein [Echinicola shivajiensis]|uniref:TolC family protein n=1 Tax=Echinicola shivajiensis TaxID=1035916 RepID=UPI001BFCCA76|nr:TolC family protein [Echinicola shivajiensis]